MPTVLQADTQSAAVNPTSNKRALRISTIAMEIEVIYGLYVYMYLAYTYKIFSLCIRRQCQSCLLCNCIYSMHEFLEYNHTLWYYTINTD